MEAGGARALGTVVWLLVVFQTPACASDFAFENGRYQNRERHYSIARPGGEGTAWRRIEVDGAALAFQGPGRATMSLIEQCGRPLPPAVRILARQLLIGLEKRTLLEEGPVAAGEGQGWMQRVEAVQDGETVHLETVTRVIRRCSYDWILVAPDESEELEAVFARWWGSFRSAAPEAGGEGRE